MAKTKRTARSAGARRARPSPRPTTGTANIPVQASGRAEQRLKASAARPERSTGTGARLQQQRRAARRPWYRGPQAIWATLIGIVIVVAIFIALANRGSGDSVFTPVSPAVFKQVTQVDPKVLAEVKPGVQKHSLDSAPPGTPVNKDASGKPIVLYVGAEYCPFCAAERWSLIVALSRFGTFSNLHNMLSSDSDSNPSTPTFSFRDSTYTSQYLAFRSREIQDRAGQDLEKLTAADEAIFGRFDYPPYVQGSGGAIPFLSIANQYFGHQSGYPVEVLTGQTREAIAAALSDPHSAVAQAILGNANYLTAAICKVTGNQPANVCTVAPIPDLQKELPEPKAP